MIVSIQLNEEHFRQSVAQKAKHLPFLKALYRTLEEYQKAERETKGIAVACGKGCSKCCYQMICVFPQEMEEIKNHIDRLPRSSKKILRNRASEMIQRWKDWFAHVAQMSPQTLNNPLLMAKSWTGKRCPFLQTDGNCGIYEARPLVCRTTTSPTQCTELAHLSDGQHSAQMRLECEKWANAMLFEFIGPETQGATPLHYFLTMKEYELRT